MASGIHVISSITLDLCKNYAVFKIIFKYNLCTIVNSLNVLRSIYTVKEYFSRTRIYFQTDKERNLREMIHICMRDMDGCKISDFHARILFRPSSYSHCKASMPACIHHWHAFAKCDLSLDHPAPSTAEVDP